MDLYHSPIASDKPHIDKNNREILQKQKIVIAMEKSAELKDPNKPLIRFTPEHFRKKIHCTVLNASTTRPSVRESRQKDPCSDTPSS